ncbi:MAG: hypothetical protein NC918_08010 [Candidatus Omnitrophica bacterium]|nr:hypothetical protein [Candidatus Omnitrophota bacterium]
MLRYSGEFYFVLGSDIVLKINYFDISKKLLSQIKKNFDFFIKDEYYCKNFFELEIYTNNIKRYLKNKKIFKFLRKDVELFYDNKKFYGIISENIFSFDTLLRILSSLVILKNNGIILHSSSIVENRKSILYVGPSGFGKSTIAKKCERNKILTDELSILFFENNKLISVRSPFWGELKYSFSKKDSVEEKFVVDRIMFLCGFVKNDRPKVEVLSFKEAVILLLKNLFWVVKDEIYNERILRIVIKIAKTTNCYKFYPLYEIQNKT